MKRSKSSQHGFSLIEIMVVIVIIGLLAGVVTVGVMQFLVQGRITTAKAQMTEFMKALDLYKMKKGVYPSSGKGLVALTKTKSSTGQPLLKEIPKDPWGNKYRYRSRGSQCKITSYGANGREGGEGESADIVISSSGKH